MWWRALPLGPTKHHDTANRPASGRGGGARSTRPTAMVGIGTMPDPTARVSGGDGAPDVLDGGVAPGGSTASSIRAEWVGRARRVAPSGDDRRPTRLGAPLRRPSGARASSRPCCGSTCCRRDSATGTCARRCRRCVRSRPTTTARSHDLRSAPAPAPPHRSNGFPAPSDIGSPPKGWRRPRLPPHAGASSGFRPVDDPRRGIDHASARSPGHLRSRGRPRLARTGPRRVKPPITDKASCRNALTQNLTQL